MVLSSWGAIIFYWEGGRLSVIDSHRFILVPTPWHAKEISGPPSACAKYSADPQQILVPPPFDPLKKTGPPLITPKNSGPPTNRR